MRRALATAPTNRAPTCLLWQHWPHAEPTPCVVLGTTRGGRVRIRFAYRAGDPVRDRYAPVNQLHPLAPVERERYAAIFDELVLSLVGVQVAAAPVTVTVEPEPVAGETETETGENAYTVASVLSWHAG